MKRTRTLTPLGEFIACLIVAGITLAFIAPALHHILFFIFNYITGKNVPV
jgi:hypothetical protein